MERAYGRLKYIEKYENLAAVGIITQNP